MSDPNEATRRTVGEETVRCAVLDAADEAAPLSAVSRFSDEGEIARGGMGSIRLVFDHRMLRHAAMKVLDGSLASRQDALRFLEEAQITGQLDHPHIVPIYDLEVGSDGMPIQFTMKLVRGRTLDELMESDSDLERLLRVFLRVCEAVSFAHSRGVIHRDLKPQNVMVGAHGQVYVMDWGVALLRDALRPSEQGVRCDPLRQTEERSGTVIGTVVYMAPEQASGRVANIDERTDVFGLGGVLYKILTGQPPHHAAESFLGALDLAQRGAVPPPEEAAPGRALPPGLCRIVMKALSADPAARHKSVAALQAEVEAFLRGGGWFLRRQFSAGAVMMREGEPGDCAYLIESGRCEVSREVDGDRQVIRTLGPGDVVGETAIVIDRPRSATVTALDDVNALVVTQESLERELDRNDWLATIVRALAERFRELERAMRP